MAAVMISRAKAMLAASGRLPFKREREMNEMLKFAVGSFAEAYQLGAEEAQNEIIRRIASVPTRSASNTGTEHG